MGMIPNADPEKERWARLQRWEEEQLSAHPPDLRRSLEWLHAAREMAARLDPEWGSLAHAEEHWRHLAWVQQCLARVRFSQ